MPAQASGRRAPPWLAALIVLLFLAGAGGMVWMMMDSGTPSITVTTVERPPARPGEVRLPPAVSRWMEGAARSQWSDADAAEGIRRLFKGYWRAKGGELVMQVETVEGKNTYSFYYARADYITPELRRLSGAADQVRARGDRSRVPDVTAAQVAAIRALAKPQGASVGESDQLQAREAFEAWLKAPDAGKRAAEAELVGILREASASADASTRQAYRAYGERLRAIFTAAQAKAIVGAGNRGGRSGQGGRP